MGLCTSVGISNIVRRLAGSSRGLDAAVLVALLDAPVEDIIVLEAFADEQIAEKLAEVRIVGLVVEAESSAVVEENTKLVGESTAQQIGRSRHLLLHDPVVLLLLGGRLETLPWESTAEEVHENISKRFEIVATGLFCDWAVSTTELRTGDNTRIYSPTPKCVLIEV